jgi:hypothetical protein
MPGLKSPYFQNIFSGRCKCIVADAIKPPLLGFSRLVGTAQYGG